MLRMNDFRKGLGVAGESNGTADRQTWKEFILVAVCKRRSELWNKLLHLCFNHKNKKS